MISKRTARTKLKEGSMFGFMHWGYEIEMDPIMLTRDWWLYIWKLYLCSFRGDFGVAWDPQ